MKARLLKRYGRRHAECEVETELRFHLELRTEENLQRGMTLAEAEKEAAKRFGNVERIKNQCVEISHRSSPLMRVLKSLLIVIFLGGVLARVFSTDIYGRQIGNMLMTITALSYLLLYLRGLRFSGFVPKDDDSSPLGLGAPRQMPSLDRVINDD